MPRTRCVRATRDRECIRCGETIPAGELYQTYRERALSSAEARNAGMYPTRHLCTACHAAQAAAGAREEVR